MTQSTSQIGADQSGLAYRNADNAGKEAILNHHMGPSAPAYAEAGIIWLNNTATPWTLNIYTGTNWITLGEVNASTNTFNPYVGTAVGRVLSYAVDTGAANAYAVAPSPARTAYAAGNIVTLKPVNANTGASTLNVNSLGTVNIKLFDGTNPYANALLTTGTYILIYDGTNFVVTNPSPVTSYLNYAADTGAANAYAVAPAPPIAAYAAGQCVMLKPGNANTGSSTINVNALGTKNIKMLDGTNPSANVLVTTGCYDLMYDGTNFVLQNPSPLALTGDVTSSGPATTLATVNSNVGSFTAANITVNAKGLITAAASGAATSVGYNAETTTYAPVAGDLGKLIDFTGSSSATWTLTAAATLGAGWFCFIRNNGTAQAELTLKSSSGAIDGIAASTGYIIYPGEERLVQCTGSAFNSLILKGFYRQYTSSGTFTVPPGYQAFDCEMWGGGGGAGTSGANVSGGGGAAYNKSLITAANMGATTQTITVGAGGAINTAGGQSSIGSLLLAYGGGKGAAAGGGGGSPTAVGGNAATSTGGTGGGPYPLLGGLSGAGGAGVGGTDGWFGGGGGYGGYGGNSISGWGGGGGAGGNTGPGAGGGSIYGGGGGGGTINVTGGTSVYGGAGGAGGTAGVGHAGSAPGGGGGAGTTGTSGSGGAGQINVRGIV